MDTVRALLGGAFPTGLAEPAAVGCFPAWASGGGGDGGSESGGGEGGGGDGGGGEGGGGEGGHWNWPQKCKPRVQLRQITVTITNTSYSFPAARRRLGTARRLGVTNITNATSPSAWAISVQVAFEGVGEARDAAERLQAAIPDAVTATVKLGFPVTQIDVPPYTQTVLNAAPFTPPPSPPPPSPPPPSPPPPTPP
eukprot:scaffold85654_cov39-Phaeocystis_antarctica.AAC.1